MRTHVLPDALTHLDRFHKARQDTAIRKSPLPDLTDTYLDPANNPDALSPGIITQAWTESPPGEPPSAATDIPAPDPRSLRAPAVIPLGHSLRLVHVGELARLMRIRHDQALQFLEGLSVPTAILHRATYFSLYALESMLWCLLRPGAPSLDLSSPGAAGHYRQAIQKIRKRLQDPEDTLVLELSLCSLSRRAASARQLSQDLSYLSSALLSARTVTKLTARCRARGPQPLHHLKETTAVDPHEPGDPPVRISSRTGKPVRRWLASGRPRKKTERYKERPRKPRPQEGETKKTTTQVWPPPTRRNSFPPGPLRTSTPPDEDSN